MAKGGKRKPVLVTSKYKPRPNVQTLFTNGLEVPAGLSRLETKAWRTSVQLAPWLTAVDVPTCVLFVKTWAKYTANPNKAPAALGDRLISLATKLGFTPAARARMNLGKAHLRVMPSKASRYFDDNDNGDDAA